MKKIELLIPCGNFDAFLAAVYNGADAVYLAMQKFGARGYANNFSNEDYLKAVKIAHRYNVKIYVTMNILLYENEIADAMQQVDFLYENDVDALIIQDLGLLELVSKCYPDLELHASTQMHIHNLKGARFITSKGVKRVVIARETPLDVIKKITSTNIDVEVFAYGALCVSYSGQCLISSVLKNRSGNRGVCAQICRMPYKVFSKRTKKFLEIKNDYLLSLKDLNVIDNIPELIKANVTSLKVEGRMKRFEYVAYVTAIFRKAIDAYYAQETFKLSKNEEENLKKLFNRGFTKGYVFNSTNNEMINSFRPNHLGIKLGKIVKIANGQISIYLEHDLHQHDGLRILSKTDIGLVANRIYSNGLLVNQAKKHETIQMDVDKYCRIGDEVVLTSDHLQLETIKNNYLQPSKKNKLNACLTCFLGQPLTIKLFDDKNEVTVKSEMIISQALTSAMSEKRILKAFDAILDTDYEFNKISISMDENIFIPIKVIKNLRRQALITFDNLRVKKHLRKGKKPYDFQPLTISLTNYRINEINNISQFQKEGLNFSNNKEILNEHIAYMNCVVDHYDQDPVSNFISQIGNMEHNRDYIAGSSFNITNSYALKFMFDNGAKLVILSNELKEFQLIQMLEAFKNRYQQTANVAILNYGRRNLMINKYNELLKYANQDFLLYVDNNYLPLFKDNLNHMIILEQDPVTNFKESDLITNTYFRYTIEKEH